MFKVFNNSVKTSKDIISTIINKGDKVIDGTAGNGNDTLFLAKLVGREGKVYAFDIQEEAIIKTRRRLIDADELEQVELIQEGHENIDRYINEKVKGAMFNLGYLPGGNHKIITRPESTVRAIDKVLEKLLPGGIVTIVIYYGHEGGLEEKDKLLEYIKRLDNTIFSVIKIDYPNRQNNPPFLLTIEKAKVEEK